MIRNKSVFRFLMGLVGLACCHPLLAQSPWSWTCDSPREEIQPLFSRAEQGSPFGEVLVIAADERPGLYGKWMAEQTVEPGQYYQFTAWRRTEHLTHARRAAVARLVWLDGAGQSVMRDEPTRASYREPGYPIAYPEFPDDGPSRDGWTPVTGVYRVPSEAKTVRIELYFRWGEPHSKVAWSGIEMLKILPPEPRVVRLATVHFQPRRQTAP